MTIRAGTKIIATNTDYPHGVSNGTIVTVSYGYNNGAVHASADNRNGIFWHMAVGTYEPYDTPAAYTPVLWRDMTPAEKGALLLAHHEGKEVQGTRIDIPDDWQCMAIGLIDYAYRVKPADPVVETVTLYGAAQYRWKFNPTMVGDTHRITFNLIDGKPDVASIKMEEL